MNLFQAIVLGIVEGITEFLPVSSTFHLIFASKLLGLSQTDFLKLFEVVIQAGAILSVLILYLKELANNLELAKKVVISFIPTAIIGFILEKIINKVFFQADMLMLIAFFTVGLIFILLEVFEEKNKINLSKDVEKLSYKDAFIIGIVQSFAVVPGVSRAGSVIVGMMLMRYKRESAARYTFMLAIPTILAAAALELFKMRDTLAENSQNLPLLLVGIVVSFVSSYVVVKWFINYLKSHSLKVFGWYRILLVIIIVLVMVFLPGKESKFL